MKSCDGHRYKWATGTASLFDLSCLCFLVSDHAGKNQVASGRLFVPESRGKKASRAVGPSKCAGEISLSDLTVHKSNLKRHSSHTGPCRSFRLLPGASLRRRSPHGVTSGAITGPAASTPPAARTWTTCCPSSGFQTELQR